MNAEELTQHVQALCVLHTVTLFPSHRPFSLPEMRSVHVPLIRDVETYAINLHEIGHVVTWEASQKRLESEVQAWLYAQRTAKVWDATADILMAEALRSYVIWAMLGRPGKRWMPPADHKLWELARMRRPDMDPLT